MPINVPFSTKEKAIKNLITMIESLLAIKDNHDKWYLSGEVQG